MCSESNQLITELKLTKKLLLAERAYQVMINFLTLDHNIRKKNAFCSFKKLFNFQQIFLMVKQSKCLIYENNVRAGLGYYNTNKRKTY